MERCMDNPSKKDGLATTLLEKAFMMETHEV